MKTKTLAVIINHNLPEYTNFLYDSLEPYQGDTYELKIFDNGSSTEGKPKVIHFETETNCYFGGALNLMFDFIKDVEEYDSLLFLSNDVILHGYNFVNTLRKEMFENDYTIVSPSVLQIRTQSDMWKQMHNYGTQSTRQVPWVDFMSPLIHKRLIKEINQFDLAMRYGWGLDIYAGIVCEKNNWKVGVVDYLSAAHLVAKTTRENKSDITSDEYFRLAQNGMDAFFRQNNMQKEQYRMMHLAQTYKL
jgi:GT2 family glycosyltransferase